MQEENGGLRSEENIFKIVDILQRTFLAALFFKFLEQCDGGAVVFLILGDFRSILSGSV